MSFTDFSQKLQFGSFSQLTTGGEGLPQHWQPNDGSWTQSEITKVLTALEVAYNNSNAAANLLENIAARTPDFFKIAKVAGNCYAFAGDFSAPAIYVDPNIADSKPNGGTSFYFNAKGSLFQGDLARTVIHELYHWFSGRRDGIFGDGVDGSLLAQATIGDGDNGLRGPTAAFENDVAAQIDGTSADANYGRLRVSHKAAITEREVPTEMRGVSYSGNRVIDTATVDPRSGKVELKFTSSSLGESRDLIVGLDGQNVIEGGKGDDYIYGGGGADTLVGGTGNNWIVGGVGSLQELDDKVIDRTDYNTSSAGVKVGVTTFKNVDGSDQFTKKAIDVGHGNDTGGGGKEFHDTVREVEEIYLPGRLLPGDTTTPTHRGNSIDKLGDVWNGVKFMDSVGSNTNSADPAQTDKIHIGKGSGVGETLTDDPSYGKATVFDYKYTVFTAATAATATQNGIIEIKIDADTPTLVRQNNTLVINGKQLLGGAKFLVDKADWVRNPAHTAPLLQFERKAALTQEEMDKIILKETERLRADLGPAPERDGSASQEIKYVGWLGLYNNVPVRVRSDLEFEYEVSSQAIVILGQQREKYVFGSLRGQPD